MKKNVYNTINKYNMLAEGDHIIVGLSGGADSVCLLYLLYSIADKLSIKITAVHLNHLLREESTVDEEFSRELCKKLNIPFYSRSVDIGEMAKILKISHETAGRAARYDLYDEITSLVGGTKIALAHHKNDRAETALLNLMRGTGLKGLSSIPPVRGNIIRPLINVSKAEILLYLKENNIKYALDYTNSEDIYARNKVRNILIPIMEHEFNGNFINTLNNSIDVFAEENDFMEQEANNAFLKHFNGEGLCIIPILSLHPAIIKRILRILLKQYYVNLTHIEKIHIENLYSLINMQSGQKISMPNGYIAMKIYDRLYITKNIIGDTFYEYPLKIDEIIHIPEINCNFYASFSKNFYEENSNKFYTIRIDYDKIVHNLTIRQKKPHDTIYLKNAGNKSLSKFLKDIKVPALKRNVLPLIFDDDNCIMVGNYRVNGNYYVDSGTRKILYITFWEDNDEAQG